MQWYCWVCHFGLLGEGRLVTSFLIAVFLPSNFHISFLERSTNMEKENSCMCWDLAINSTWLLFTSAMYLYSNSIDLMQKRLLERLSATLWRPKSQAVAVGVGFIPTSSPCCVYQIQHPLLIIPPSSSINMTKWIVQNKRLFKCHHCGQSSWLTNSLSLLQVLLEGIMGNFFLNLKKSNQIKSNELLLIRSIGACMVILKILKHKVYD